MSAKSLIRNGFIGSVGIVASFVVVEIGLRVIEWTPAWKVLPVVERELGWPDPDLGYALRPNLEIINVRENRARPSTNNFGMRGRAHELVKKPGSFRVILTGDSFTEALQVEDHETFAHLAELALNKANTASSIELLNFGMSGAGPVQQLTRAQLSAQQFSADALVMLIDINQFLSEEMSNDSMNPAYIEDAEGKLTLGYTFRQRRSQGLRESILGTVFFALMDHSRIVRAIYLRYLQGAVPNPSSRPMHQSVARSCASWNAELFRQTELWRKQSPSGAASRLSKFLNDIATLSTTLDIRSSIIFYGVTQPAEMCTEEVAHRSALMSKIKAVLGSRSITLWDAEDFIRSELDAGQSTTDLHGFGSRTGTGHLNHTGHQIYSRLLGSVVTELIQER